MRQTYKLKLLLISAVVVSGSLSTTPAFANSYGDGYGGRCGYFDTPNSPTQVMKVSVTEEVWSKKESLCRGAYDAVEEFRLNKKEVSPWQCKKKKVRPGHSAKNDLVTAVQCSRNVEISDKTYKLVADGTPSGYLITADVKAPLKSLQWARAGDQRSRLLIEVTEQSTVDVDQYVKCKGKKVSVQKKQAEVAPGKTKRISLYVNHVNGPAARAKCGKGFSSFTNYVEVKASSAGASTTNLLEF